MSDNELIMFDANDATGQLPAHLQGLGLNTTGSLMAAIAESLNRIGVKGNRFRQIINGEEVAVWDENYLDVIIVGVVPTVSRLFYAGKFKQTGDNAPPTCFSVDNIAPPIDLPTKQSDVCATCPQNIKGSRISEDGHEGKACGFFRRMVVMLPYDESRRLYRIDVKSQGLFGESHEKVNKFSMNDYAKFLQNRGVDASVLVTRLSFDTNSSTPKLLFQPNRYVTAEEIGAIQEIGPSQELQDYLKINFKTVNLSNEKSAPDEVEEDVPAPAAPQAAPKPVATPQAAKPVATPTPVAKPTPVAPKPVATAPKPVATAPKPTVQAPKPAAAKPVAVAPKPVAKPVQVEIDTNVAEPEVQEVGTASELEDLIGELGL